MPAKSTKSTPDRRRTYDDAFQADSLRLTSAGRSAQVTQQSGISPRLLYRCQQARLVTEVGSVKVARNPEVRQLRAKLKWVE